MSVTWERLAGRTDRFAMKLALMDDPDHGEGIDRDVASSWGSFQLWAEGQNLCAHTEIGEIIESVHWYLLPLLEWLTDNWDALLHEERLPSRNAAAEAATSLRFSRFPPERLDEESATRWDREWSAWWHRHSLQAARQGGLFPDVMIRRWRDRVEVSWDTPAIAGTPKEVGFRFLSQDGVARLEPQEVASPLHTILREAAEELLSRAPNSERVSRLRDKIEGLASVEWLPSRSGWLAGLGASSEESADEWRRLVEGAAGLSQDQVITLFGDQHDDLVIRRGSSVALVFGALSPRIQPGDVDMLMRFLIASASTDVKFTRLNDLAGPVDLPRDPSDVVMQAIELAEFAAESIGVPPNAPIDLEAIFDDLGITRSTIALTDSSVRGVALAGEGLVAAVALNESYPWSFREEVARFSLAHELCHLLFDQNAASRVAVASGQWAPRDIERRANAFAAYFLMPASLVEAAVVSAGEPPSSPEGLKAVAGILRTSLSATLEQLFNFGFLDEYQVDELRDSFHWSRMDRARPY